MAARAGRRRAAAWLSLSLCPLVAHGGRPLDTDDAAIIPSGSCQVESFARRNGAIDGGAPNRDYGFAPTCNPFGIGEIQLAGNRYGVGPTGSVTETFLQYKDVPVATSRSHPGLGFDLSYADDHVRGRREPSVRAVAAVGVASVAPFDGWQFDGNVGALRRLGPSDGSARGHAIVGAAAEWSVTPRLTVVGERFGTSGLGHDVQAGVAFVASPRVTVDAAVGRRAQPNGRATFATIGLTWVSKSGVITPE